MPEVERVVKLVENISTGFEGEGHIIGSESSDFLGKVDGKAPYDALIAELMSVAGDDYKKIFGKRMQPEIGQAMLEWTIDGKWSVVDIEQEVDEFLLTHYILSQAAAHLRADNGEKAALSVWSSPFALYEGNHYTDPQSYEFSQAHPQHKPPYFRNLLARFGPNMFLVGWHLHLSVGQESVEQITPAGHNPEFHANRAVRWGRPLVPLFEIVFAASSNIGRDFTRFNSTRLMEGRTVNDRRLGFPKPPEADIPDFGREVRRAKVIAEELVNRNLIPGERAVYLPVREEINGDPSRIESRFPDVPIYVRGVALRDYLVGAVLSYNLLLLDTFARVSSDSGLDYDYDSNLIEIMRRNEYKAAEKGWDAEYILPPQFQGIIGVETDSANGRVSLFNLAKQIHERRVRPLAEVLQMGHLLGEYERVCFKERSNLATHLRKWRVRRIKENRYTDASFEGFFQDYLDYEDHAMKVEVRAILNRISPTSDSRLVVLKNLIEGRPDYFSL